MSELLRKQRDYWKKCFEKTGFKYKEIQKENDQLSQNFYDVNIAMLAMEKENKILSEAVENIKLAAYLKKHRALFVMAETAQQTVKDLG